MLLLVPISSVTQEPRRNYLHCWCHTFPLRCTCLVFPGSQGLEGMNIGDHSLRKAIRLLRRARCDRADLSLLWCCVNQVLGQLDWSRYWNGTTAYKD